jgi:ankyrin repeat protein
MIVHLQDGATPLFKACHKGHLEVVQELLANKPNIGLLQVSYSLSLPQVIKKLYFHF